MKRSVVVLLISGAFAFFIACTSRVELPPRSLGSKIYFVPIGDFPIDQMQQLADYYHRGFGLEILILKSMAVPATAEDEDRRQLVAEKLIDDLRNTFPELAADPKAILIGFTSLDMYPAGKQWRFAFGWRDANARTAVVSTARMSLHYRGQPFWGTSVKVRLRKIVTKDIGILYYGLSPSDNPKSVLYNSILGIQELDEVGESF